MTDKESREIRLDEFEELHRKMKLYNMQKGFIGFVKDKLELFVMPCEKATAEITKEQVIEAITARFNATNVLLPADAVNYR